MLKFALFLVLCTVAYAQLPGLGRCPSKRPKPNFDVESLMGTWYEVGRYAGVTNLGSKCNTEAYALNDDGTIGFIDMRIVSLTGETIITPGIGKQITNNGDAKFSVVYFTKPIKTEVTLLVLDTDYKNYSVAYSCKQVGPLNVISASIFTRKPVPEKEILDHAYNVVDLNGLNSKLILKINQKECNINGTQFIGGMNYA